MKKNIISIIWLTLVIASFGLGYAVGQNTIPSVEKIEGLSGKEINKPLEVDFSLFWDAWHLLEKKYIERDSLDRQQMVYGGDDCPALCSDRNLFVFKGVFNHINV